MHRGYVKLWRKCLGSECWKNSKLWRVWTWCLLKAAWDEVDQLVGGQTIHLLPGQFITGRKRAATETGLSEQEIRNQLNNLQNNQQITIKSTNKFSVISIVNWGDYQTESTSKTTSKTADKQPAKQPQTRRYKKNKEDKNIYIYIGDYPNIQLTQEEYDKLVARLGETATMDKIEALSLYLQSTGKRYRSHYATILNWVRRDNGHTSGRIPTKYTDPAELEEKA